MNDNEVVNVAQYHFVKCHHVELGCHREAGKTYKVTLYLDLDDWCPSCKAQRTRERRARRDEARKRATGNHDTTGDSVAASAVPVVNHGELG